MVAAGELGGGAEAEGGSEPDLAQHLSDAAVRVVEPVDRQRLHEDAVDRMARVQRAIGVLEHHLHQLVEGLVAARPLLATGDDDPAGPVGIEAAQRAQHGGLARTRRSEEHTSELQSLMRISYAVICLKKKKKKLTKM